MSDGIAHQFFAAEWDSHLLLSILSITKVAASLGQVLKNTKERREG